MAKAKKSASVKLTPEKSQELKDAIISGETPKSIHERLGVTIHNIHYHKGELKKKGLLTGNLSKKSAPAKKAVAHKPVVANTKAGNPVVSKPAPSTKSKSFKLIVNGVTVSIEGAGSVAIGEGFIKVNY